MANLQEALSLLPVSGILVMGLLGKSYKGQLTG